MTDLEVFSANTFEPRAWINEVCLARPVHEPVESYLAELEIRLHLTAEDVEAALQEQSRDALYRIPAAVQEISHTKVRSNNPHRLTDAACALLKTSCYHRATCCHSDKECTGRCSSSIPTLLLPQTVLLY